MTSLIDFTQHLLDHRKSMRESSRKTSTSALLMMPNLWRCGSQQTMENSERDGNTRPPDLPPEKSYAGQEETVRTGHGTTDWFQIGKGICQGCILSVQFSSVTRLCPTLCNPMNRSTPGHLVQHQLPEPTQTHVHWVSDASNHLILCHPLLLLPSIFPNIRVFSNESALCIR